MKRLRNAVESVLLFGIVTAPLWLLALLLVPLFMAGRDAP